MPRIDDAHAVQARDPQLAVGRPRDLRSVAARNRAAPDPIGVVENRGLDCPPRIFVSVYCGGPPVHFRAWDANQPAGHVQPQGMIVVLDRPMNRIAGQSVLAGQRSNAAVLQPAESALCSGPDRTVGIELKTGNPALAQPVGGRVGSLDLAAGKISNAALIKSKP